MIFQASLHKKKVTDKSQKKSLKKKKKNKY